MDWGTTWTVVLTGLLVVFCILIILTFVILGYGTLVYRIQNRKKSSPKSPEIREDKPQAAQPTVIPAAPAQEEGISGEIIAAIAAAVAVMGEGTGTSYSIRSVKRSSGSRPVWSTAGLMENTRPF
ncbi:MAG: OadG family protein [Clostridiales bacterium]|jgi:sodium pump decarboxylase gamma subunit|nr:OadG family protein [Clostridiales bacterium]